MRLSRRYSGNSHVSDSVGSRITSYSSGVKMAKKKTSKKKTVKKKTAKTVAKKSSKKKTKKKRLTQSDLKKIIAKSIPGTRVISMSTSKKSAEDSAEIIQSDSVSPSIAKMRNKYFNATQSNSSDSVIDASNSIGYVVEIEPQTGDAGKSAGSKTVLIDEDGEIIGEQG